MLAAAAARLVSPTFAGRERAIAAFVGALALALVALPGALERTGTPARVLSGEEPVALPLAAQGAISRVLGRDDRSYHVQPAGSGLAATNRRHGLEARFSQEGVQVRSGTARLGLALRAWGYGEALRPLGSAAPQARANRVEYRRGPLSEWYVNGPAGLQQGFTLAAPPATGAGGSLTLALSLSGTLRPALEPGGDGLVLGGSSLRYRGLLVFDATGRELPARLELRDRTLLLRVEDSRARYPLTIDPFVQQAKLSASDGAAFDEFGVSVAVSGDTVVVGAWGDDVGANAGQGSAYVFVKPAAGWANTSETAKLTASDGAFSDVLGFSVAVSGGTVVAGAPRDDVGANGEQGSAYVFVKPVAGWANATETAKLTASDGAASDVLGFSVAVSGDTVVAGAPGDDVGSAYVFVKPAAGWANATETAKLIAPDGAAGDELGRSVAVSGDTVVAGARGDAVGANARQGSAYVFGVPATFIVNSTGDGADSNTADGVCDDGSGNCTLRAAIQQANASLGANTIQFGIGSGTKTIAPGSALPTISDPVTLDATTQPGFAGSPIIELNGSSAGSGPTFSNGLTISAGSSTVKGLVINRFYGAGVFLLGGTGNVVQGNYIGTSVAGTADLGNVFDGVIVFDSSSNTIGGSSASSRNVISGNNSDGISLVGASTGNLIEGNYIGTDAAGTSALANSEDGVFGGGSFSGVTGNTVKGNVISGNGDDGVRLNDAGSTGNLVQGNKIGTDATGSNGFFLGNGGEGVFIDGSAGGNTIGGTGVGAGNLITGNKKDGVLLSAAGTGNQVQGNKIGTDVGNFFYGVRIASTAGTVVGGTSAGAGNLISGNGQGGVLIIGGAATGNLVQGNYIGTDAAGAAAVGNTGNGVRVNAAPANTIGGVTAGAGNVISGNTANGVLIYAGSTGNLVQGNKIGTNATGTAALPNGIHGVRIEDAPATTIGGTTAGARNVISGNSFVGVSIVGSGASGNLVQGNYIGTNAAGTAAVPNVVGVGISAPGNTIGGTASGAGNVISGNSASGVSIGGGIATGNVVQGNLIGTDAAGTAALGNGGDGVEIVGNNNTIGGVAAGAGNTIAFNGRGVLVDSSAGNAIRLNSIFANGALGIDLFPYGVTPNDPGDPDGGANNLQNYPVLNAAANVGGAGTMVQGTFNSTPLTTFALEFFSNPACDPSGFGEGKSFLGSTTVTTDGSGNASFTFTATPAVPLGQFIAATATNPGNSTSEFSNCKEVKSAAGVITDLIGDVQGLGLNKGIENSLVVKLQHAAAQAAAGNTTVACNQLNAFINEVDAQSGKALTPEEAALLKAIAQLTKAAIGCP